MKHLNQILKNGRLPINLETLPYKIHYFLYLSAVSGILPFISVFSKSKFHLTNSQVASLYAVYQLITVFTKPVIGFIVDYFNKLKIVIITLTFLLASSALLLLAVPGLDKDADSRQKFQTSTILKCSSSIKDDSVECDLIQHVCYNINAINFTDFGAKRIDSDLCRTFNCCGNDKLVPHSTASNSLRCTKKYGDAKSSLRTCIKFRKSNDTNSFEARILHEKTKKLKDQRSVNGTYVVKLCSSSNTSNYYVSNAEKLFMYTEKDSNNYFECNFRNLNPNACNLFEELSSKSGNSCDTGNRVVMRESSPYLSYQFWVFGAILLCIGICSNALFTLSDTACHEVLQRTRSDYGRQRLWGAVGWGLVAPLAGYLNDMASGSGCWWLPEYSPGMFVCACFSVLLVLNVIRLDMVKPDMPKKAYRDVSALFKNREFTVFAVGVFLTGFFVSSIWYYLSVFLLSVDASKLLMGLVQTSQCVLGIMPFMFFSGWILKKTGHMNAMVLTFLSYAVRFVSYYFLSDPWLILPIEITHGISYGLFYSALTSFAKSYATKGTEATTQGLLCCIYEGLGAGTGCIVVGICFDHLGYRKTFLLLGIMATVAALLQVVACWWLKSLKRTVEITCPETPIGSNSNNQKVIEIHKLKSEKLERSSVKN